MTVLCERSKPRFSLFINKRINDWTEFEVNYLSQKLNHSDEVYRKCKKKKKKKIWSLSLKLLTGNVYAYRSKHQLWCLSMIFSNITPQICHHAKSLCIQIPTLKSASVHWNINFEVCLSLLKCQPLSLYSEVPTMKSVFIYLLKYSTEIPNLKSVFVCLLKY